MDVGVGLSINLLHVSAPRYDRRSDTKSYIGDDVLQWNVEYQYSQLLICDVFFGTPAIV